ncbi:ROK family protein [Pseudothermotoga sp. U03pept]|uniref:ROK family protein n=1 Tax=Pseudothermotoga sp. U03pept TaxID=3447012 RepID=UPI003F0EB919
MFFVCDIGGTNLRMAVTDLNGTILNKHRVLTPRNYDELLKTVEDQFRENSKRFHICGCCISVAGAVLENKEVWLPNLFGLERLKVAEDLQNLLSGIEVHVIDDRTAGLLGEIYKGCAVSKKNVLYLIIGTGVGLGILIDGVVVSGSERLAGSVGWIRVIDPLTGRIDTVENTISGPGILKRFNTVCKNSASSPEEIFRLYKQEADNCVRHLVQSTSKVVGYLLSVLVNIFNPEIIILAGSLALQWDVFQDEAIEVLKQNISPSIKRPPVRISNLGEDAQLLGCTKYLLSIR